MYILGESKSSRWGKPFNLDVRWDINERSTNALGETFMVNPKYDPKPDLFMGGILVNLGYIQPEQRDQADVLDKVAKDLQKGNPNFKKPFYGHIANGDQAQSIVDEYKRQVDSGLYKPDKKVSDDMSNVDVTKLGLKGEKAGSDIERKGGPIDSCLQVQKELRELEKMNLLPDTAEKMKDTTRGIADKLKVDYPQSKDAKAAERNVDLDFMLCDSARSMEHEPEPEQISAPEPLRLKGV